MKHFTAKYEQNIFDIAIQEYGNLDSLFLLLDDNNLSPDSTINPNQELIKSDNNEFIFEINNTKVNISTNKQIKRYSSINNQNLFDVILNEYGTLENSFDFLIDNNLSPSSTINPNMSLITNIQNLEKGNKKVKEYIFLNNVYFANKIISSELTGGDFNDDYNNDYYR